MEAGEAAKARIEAITAEVEVGKIYEGTVLKLLDFGAIVSVLPGRDGLLHISQIAHERVNQVADYLKEGQQVRVKVLEADDKGRLRLSMKALHAEELGTFPTFDVPMHRNTRRNDPLGSRDHFVLASTTLMEWSLAAFIPQPVTGPKVFLHEGNIAAGDAPGELKMVMRKADWEDERKMTDPPRAFSTVSRDGGRTWSPAQQEPDLWNAQNGYFELVRREGRTEASAALGEALATGKSKSADAAAGTLTIALEGLDGALERDGDVHLGVEDEEADHGHLLAQHHALADVLDTREPLGSEDHRLALLELRHLGHIGS